MDSEHPNDCPVKGGMVQHSYEGNHLGHLTLTKKNLGPTNANIIFSNEEIELLGVIEVHALRRGLIS
jgi:hypothetical protein